MSDLVTYGVGPEPAGCHQLVDEILHRRAVHRSQLSSPFASGVDVDEVESVLLHVVVQLPEELGGHLGIGWLEIVGEVVGPDDDLEELDRTSDGPIRLSALGPLHHLDVQGGVGNEQGIDGVRVELYADTGDGVADIAVDTFIDFRTTAGGGFYLFDDLNPATLGSGAAS